MSYAFPQIFIKINQKEGRTFLNYTVCIRDKMSLFNILLYGQKQIVNSGNVPKINRADLLTKISHNMNKPTLNIRCCQ